ncbi:MAG: hypothetical protein ACPGVO_00025 [Spirulinaceae cyanobacterium]
MDFTPHYSTQTDYQVPGFTTIVADANQQFLEVPLSQVTRPQSVGQALTFFLEEPDVSDSQKKGVQSVFFRHLTPALGGPSHTCARLTHQASQEAQAFLADLPLTALTNVDEKIEQYSKQAQLPKSVQNNLRSKFKAFEQWMQQQDWFSAEPDPPEPLVIYRHSQGAPPNVNKRGRSFANQMFGRDLAHYQVVAAPVIPFGWHQMFMAAAGVSLRSHKLGLILLWIVLRTIEPALALGNPDLDRSLLEFANFLFCRCNRSFQTVRRDVHEILRAFDWVVTTEKIPLAELSLQDLVEAPPLPKTLRLSTFCKQYPNNPRRAREELALAKVMAQETLDETVKTSRQRLERYLNAKDVQHDSRVNYTKSWINLARYLYADQTEHFKPERGFEDVPIIRAFRQLANTHCELAISSGEKTRMKQAKRQRMVPWPAVFLAVDLAFQKYEQKDKTQVTRTKRAQRADGSPRICQVDRSDLAIARDLKRALILAIATALPPGRSKVYYSLELGKTLIRGCFNATGTAFTPYDKLSPLEQENALWWLDLTPADGKRNTIDVGGWTCHIPNRRFRTGKTLYDYMDEWLAQWRPFLGQNPLHNYFFTTEKGRAVDSSHYGYAFERALAQFTGYTGVRPHLLRSILVTYALEQNITDAERRSLAKMQRHSEEQQRKNYTELQSFQELRPAQNMMERFATEIEGMYELKAVEVDGASAELCLKDAHDLDPDVVDLLSPHQLQEYKRRKCRSQQ